MILPLFRLVLLTAGPVVLFLLPDGALQSLPDLCLIKLTFGIECWGCGMTRALHAMVHADFSGALAFNWRAFIVAPLLVFLAARSLHSDAMLLYRNNLQLDPSA